MLSWNLSNARAPVVLHASNYASERSGPLLTHCPRPTNTYRDTVIRMSKDVRRTVDCLETGPEVDKNKLAMFDMEHSSAQNRSRLIKETLIGWTATWPGLPTRRHN